TGVQTCALPILAPSKLTFPVSTGASLPTSWPSALEKRYKGSATESRRRYIEQKKQDTNSESKKLKLACMRAPNRHFEAMNKKSSRSKKKRLLSKSGLKT